MRESESTKKGVAYLEGFGQGPRDAFRAARVILMCRGLGIVGASPHIGFEARFRSRFGSVIRVTPVTH